MVQEKKSEEVGFMTAICDSISRYKMFYRSLLLLSCGVNILFMYVFYETNLRFFMNGKAERETTTMLKNLPPRRPGVTKSLLLQTTPPSEEICKVGGSVLGQPLKGEGTIFSGLCFFDHPDKTAPKDIEGGFLGGIDYFHYRSSVEREACYLYCLQQLGLHRTVKGKSMGTTLLAEAASLGLPEVSRHLMETFEADPRTPVRRMGLNAVQEAILGGFAEVVEVLTGGDPDYVVDDVDGGRTVRDYVTMVGSPILPQDAKSVLGIDVNHGVGPAFRSDERRRRLTQVRHEHDRTGENTTNNNDEQSMAWKTFSEESHEEDWKAALEEGHAAIAAQDAADGGADENVDADVHTQTDADADADADVNADVNAEEDAAFPQEPMISPTVLTPVQTTPMNPTTNGGVSLTSPNMLEPKPTSYMNQKMQESLIEPSKDTDAIANHIEILDASLETEINKEETKQDTEQTTNRKVQHEGVTGKKDFPWYHDKNMESVNTDELEVEEDSAVNEEKEESPPPPPQFPWYQNEEEKEVDKEAYNLDLGWDDHTDFPIDEHCDVDEIYGDLTQQEFMEKYFVTGRPFILRAHVPTEEIKKFSKSRWDTTEQFHSQTPVRVGPTAYPRITGQSHCSTMQTISQIESGLECPDDNLHDVPMVHAHHPKPQEYDELFPQYDGDIYDPRGGWRSLRQWFGAEPDQANLQWQIFFGGDGSGATLHWHRAAVNILYVGIKEWRISPPQYRGWTGMPARKASAQMDSLTTLRCVQRPGDTIFIPNDWGHLTINHGFTIGMAVLLVTQYQTDGIINYMQQTYGTDYGAENLLQKLSRTQGRGNGNGNGRAQGRGNGNGRAQGQGQGQVVEGRAPLLRGKKPSPKRGDGRGRQDDSDSAVPQSIPFLFIHINKTGGTSLIEMFRSRCRDQYVSQHWGRGQRSFHATTTAYLDFYGRELYDNAFTFAVVRHPLARQVSNFFFLASNCEPQVRRCVDRRIPKIVMGERVHGLTDEEKIAAFDQWVVALYKQYPPGSPDHYLFASLGHGNEILIEKYGTPDVFNATQTSWMVDSSTGMLNVDKIYHLEDLSKDMSMLTDYIPCLKERGEMPHSNAAPTYPNYRRFAQNPQTRRIIAEVFEADFRNFGYGLSCENGERLCIPGTMP